VGLGVSILLIALGAILAFAVERSPSGLNVHTVGWILMGVGVLGLFLTLLFWESWWGRRGWGYRGSYPAHERRPGWYGYRRSPRVVEEEIVDEGAPPAGPPGGPPPGPPPPP
jgi:Domain of unknown function (DUF6458)